MQPFPLAFAWGPDIPWNAQRIVNLYPVSAELERGEKPKSPFKLMGTPGMTEWADLTADYIVRGMIVMDDLLYVVAGDAMYRIASNGTATAMTGSIDGNGPVTLAENGSQILIGTDATADYVLSGTTVAAISDADFLGASSVAVLNQFGIFAVPGTDTWGITDLGDFTDVDALDFVTAEYSSDLIVRIFVNAGEILVFGQRTLELWGPLDVGDATTFPFQRYPGTNGIIERGCAAAQSVVSLDQSVFWMADDWTIRRLEGLTPRKISTFSLDDKMTDFTTVSDAVATGHVWKGRPFYAITFPSHDRTYVLDVSNGLWHERRSGDVTEGQWRVRHYAWCYNKHLFSSRNDGKIFYLDDTVYTEDGDTFIAEVVSPHLRNMGDYITLDALRFDVKTGYGTGTPVMLVSVSRNNGESYETERSLSIGASGAYTTLPETWHFGEARTFTVKARIAGAWPREFYAAFAEVY